MSGSATKLKKRRRPSVSPLTTKAEIEAHKSLERRKQEADSREKKVSVVISKDGEEPVSQKELYKKKIAKHIEKRKINGGESPAESPEMVAKPRPKRAKLKLLVTQTEPKNDLVVDKENANEDTNTSKSKKRELSEERIPSPNDEFRPCNPDLFDENKYDMPNSQLPVPGREAYWDMDTPETKKFRESLYSSDSPLEEPELHLDASPTLDAKLKLKPRRRLEQLPENKVKVEESALDKAMRLCREAEEEEERERLKEEEEMQRWNMGVEEMEENGGIVEENTRAETEDTTKTEKKEEEKKLDSEEAIFNVSTEPIERDMFEDTPDEQDHNNEKVDIDLNCSNIVKQIDFEALDIKEDDGFDEDLDDGQDSFLVAASQMVEDPVVKEEAATAVKEELVKMGKDKKATEFKFKREPKPLLPPAVARLQQMGESDGFGSDDSFDEQMSQLPPGGFGTPASPVLKKRHPSPRTSSGASSRSPALSTRSRSVALPPSGHPKLPSPTCATSSLPGIHPKVIGNISETIKPLVTANAALKPPLKPSDQNKQSSPGWKRFSSFDQKTSQSSSSSSGIGSSISSSTVTGSSFKRVKSSPVVSQLRSQEEIDRKRKEAMAKREEAGRRRIKSEEEAERKKREEAEKRQVEVEKRKVEAEKKKREEVEKRKREADKKRRDEEEKYNKSVMREAEENRKKELKMKEEGEALRLKEAKDKEEAVKKMKEEIERKKREAKERLARSRSQQSQQQGVKIGSAVR